MPASRLDQLYRKLILTNFFVKGWGKPDNLKRLFQFRKILSNRETCFPMVPKDYPIHIDKEYRDGNCRILEGHFVSPFVHQLPGIMPKDVEKASFQMMLPLRWQHPTHRPVCIHLAGTGDHYFWRRRVFTAKPLLKEAGIASIILENPYYGSRKPKDQVRSSLHNVSDLFVMGGALVLECLALLHWCEREGWGPLGVSGVSMGGHMASLAATNWPKPISLIPCLSWSTASYSFTQGVLSGSIPWNVLQEQFFRNSIYHDELKKLIVSPEMKRGKAYNLGTDFVKEYSASSAQSVACESAPGEPCSSEIKGETFKKQASNVTLSSDNYMEEVSVSITSSPESSKFSSDTSEHFQSDLSKPQNVVYPQSGSTTLLSSATSNDSVNADMSQQAKRSIRKIPPKPLTLSYAETKMKQSAKPTAPAAKKSEALTFKHALSKSNLAKAPTLPVDERMLKTLQQESLNFMRGVMDECTHLGNFSVPVDPALIIIVAAEYDAYVPRDGVLGLDQLWPGCEIRYINQGHIGAVLWKQAAFRQAVIDSFKKQVEKYYSGSSNDVEARHFRTSL